MARRSYVGEKATIAWVGLVVYIFVFDVFLLITGRKTMTEVWEDAMRHPGKRWLIILAWGFTTKHLFFRWLLPWLDPFGAIAGAAILIKKITPIGDNNDSRRDLASLARFNNSPFPSGDSDS